ncbi:HEAT repeat domain-containing protein [Phormidesmis priestleyi]|uniref:HEAT repeat domain-containing protein n=1 Tax=Phormidesmis priestleyi TaxID=268141 RepID=UPI00083A1E52|nr:HEAT repeat domain-containing protein [Phormidesmis priestleyi]
MRRRIDRPFPRFPFRVHRSVFIGCFLAFLFSLSIGVSFGNAKEKPKPKLQEWQINGILAALDDGYSGVKQKAFEKLVEFDAADLKAFPKQSEEIGKRALAALNDSKEDSYLRPSAAVALSNLDKTNPAAVQALTTVLNNSKESSDLRYSTAVALSNLDKTSPVAVQFLTTVLNDSKENFDFRSRAIVALSNLDKASPVAVQALTIVLNDSKENSALRYSAALALSNLDKASPAAVQALTTVLNNSKESSDLRYSTAVALSNLDKTSPVAVQFLTTVLNDSKENSALRSRAAVALSNLDKTSPVAVQFLTTVLNDSKESSDLRSRAAWALGNLDKTSPVAVQALVTLFSDSKENSDLRYSAAEALGNLDKTSPVAVQALTTVLNNSKEGSALRYSAAEALGNLDKTSPAAMQALTTVLNNSKEYFYLRYRATEALGNLGRTSPAAVQALTTVLNNSKEYSSLRSSAALALGNLKQLSLGEIFVLIDRTFDVASEDLYKMRFSSYFYSRGDSNIKTLMRWVSPPESLSKPDELSADELRKALGVFKKAWEPSRDFPRLRKELAGAIASVSSRGKWHLSDALLLEQHYKNLSSANFDEADTVKKAIDALTVWKHLKESGYALAAHLLFWVALIFAYPKYSWVQAVFFWNPWVRKIIGVGYVGFLLAWVPFLRRKLFEPFKFSLLADARLTNFDPTAYFPESNVILVGSRHVTPLNTTLTAIQGQTILEGSSGLGKSMFLRHLVQQSSRIVVFLPARKCENGVIEAIQAKLHGQAQDAEFLKNLIYSGAIDICIDGLNEVSADTRAKISQFVESYFKGNIILTTQPIEWIAPTTAKIYELQPLQTDQIETFLLSRSAIVAPTSEATYADSCRSYLAQALNPNQSSEELAATQRILSNPMDLTVVAQMIALGKTPDLFRLQEQQYQLMAADYHDRWNQDFPIKKFAEALYQLRLNDEKAIPPSEFLQELTSMEDEQYKMVVSRQWKDAKGEPQHEWYCRHDKIMEFFIVQTFLGDGETAQNRLIDHMGDSRFRGVYFLLATLLSLDAAADLREKLILYAANTKDHTVSDTFVQLFHSRATLNAEVASLI